MIKEWVKADPSRVGCVCIFCLCHRDRPGQGDTCTYGMRHEYPEDDVVEVKVKVQKRDANLCIKCGMHPKNPKAAGCEHEFA